MSSPLHTDATALLHHGGRLRDAAARYHIPLEQWLDLSTGINPHGWPVPNLPARVWNRLPEEEDGLIEAARNYYHAPHLLAVAGSQAAIQALPLLRAPARVAMVSPAYAEHAHAWRRAGHTLIEVKAEQIGELVDIVDVVVLVHPNNPSAARYRPEQLVQWHTTLAQRGGWLIVDEAFMDTTPEQSLCAESARTGLIVLRSLGKFFGLAGLRVGFVAAAPELLQRLQALLGPWAVSGPSRHVATLALRDTKWQNDMRRQLQQEGERLRELLTQSGLTPSGGTALFQWLVTPLAEKWHRQLAAQGILTRLFTAPASLRFGLPADEAAWTRLQQALREVRV